MGSLTETPLLSVTFSNDSCTFQDSFSMKTIGKGERISDLYVMTTGVVFPTAVYCKLVVNNVSPKI